MQASTPGEGSSRGTCTECGERQRLYKQATLHVCDSCRSASTRGRRVASNVQQLFSFINNNCRDLQSVTLPVRQQGCVLRACSTRRGRPLSRHPVSC